MGSVDDQFKFLGWYGIEGSKSEIPIEVLTKIVVFILSFLYYAGGNESEHTPMLLEIRSVFFITCLAPL